jgi:hypothetical protein
MENSNSKGGLVTRRYKEAWLNKKWMEHQIVQGHLYSAIRSRIFVMRCRMPRTQQVSHIGRPAGLAAAAADQASCLRVSSHNATYADD